MLWKARRVFEAVLNYANHLGLTPRSFDARSSLSGNFPQAFTHLALISAAYYLDRELDGKKAQEWRLEVLTPRQPLEHRLAIGNFSG